MSICLDARLIYWCIHGVRPTAGSANRQSCGPTVKVGVVAATLDKGAAADAARRLRAVAQVRGQPAGGAVRADLQVAARVPLNIAISESWPCQVG
jgi:hypothetical protein